MEMSQRISFWYLISNFTKNSDCFEKMAKKHFFGKNVLWQAKNNNFELRNAKIAWKSC